MQYDLIISGAGPAGLMCAISTAHCGARVLILEKKTAAGRKLLLSGSGRCNLTHAGDIHDFFPHYGPSAQFIKPALMAFSNSDLRDFFFRHGLTLIELNDGKLFPITHSSRDVLRILLQAAREKGVQFYYEKAVTETVFLPELEQFMVKTHDGSCFYSHKLALTTGGMSFPSTGSTGDGYILAQQLGHTCTARKPALAPVYISDYVFQDCAGISVQNAPVSLWRENYKICSYCADVLFTHHGLSGPAILDLSREMLPGDILKITLLPGFSQKSLDERFRQLLQENSRRELKNIPGLLGVPERLTEKILFHAGIPFSLRAADVTRDTRVTLVNLMLGYPFKIARLGDFREAMVTCGGITLSEVNRKTLESRLIPGLYFCGEILDVDAHTGGYNLQFAFSSGVLAGKHIGLSCGNCETQHKP